MISNSVKPIANGMSDSVLSQMYSWDGSSNFPLIPGLEYVLDECGKTTPSPHTEQGCLCVWTNAVVKKRKFLKGEDNKYIFQTIYRKWVCQ